MKIHIKIRKSQSSRYRIPFLRSADRKEMNDFSENEEYSQMCSTKPQITDSLKAATLWKHYKNMQK